MIDLPCHQFQVCRRLNDSYNLGCEMERKRVECAIMIKFAMADEN